MCGRCIMSLPRRSAQAKCASNDDTLHTGWLVRGRQQKNVGCSVATWLLYILSLHLLLLLLLHVGCHCCSTAAVSQHFKSPLLTMKIVKLCVVLFFRVLQD